MEESSLKIVVAAIILISISFLYVLYVASSLSLIIRVVLAIVILVLAGIAIQRLLKLTGGYGFYMMGSKKGLTTMDSLSKNHQKFWEYMWQWGLTLGFGILAYPLMKGKIDKRVYVFGLITLVVIILLVEPYIANATQFINLAPIQNAVASSQQSVQQGPSLLSIIVAIATVIAGFSGYLFIALFANTELILWSVIKFLTNPSLGTSGSGLSSQIPGVAPIIPGIDIPLFAGIISLAILLIVHEFSHGVLARKYKVKLKSTGVLVFGFIPVGGYVEPDEKMVSKLNNVKQTGIFAAGISANFIAMFVFLVLMLLTVTFLVPIAYQYKVIITEVLPNYPANGILKSGMQVLKWDNTSISNLTALESVGSTIKPNQTFYVTATSASASSSQAANTYKFKAVASPSNASRGIIGVSLEYEPVIEGPFAKSVYFLYSVFALSMLLNFLVAIVNLLPIPGLDGWRIYYANIKSERFIKFMAALVIILIVLNVIPWIFYL
jgi:membrane-associated protease RseP (regulator of RpoE activity)